MVGKRMNKIKLVIIFVVGFLLGIIATIKLFGIKDIDILSLPYRHHGVVLQEQVVVEQDGINLILPKGMEFNVLYHAPEGFSIYYIPLTFGPYQQPKTKDLMTRAKSFKEPTARWNQKSKD
jgi:hypothetical protein